MERVTGIGGVFFRSKDPEALACWYAEHLGIDAVSEEATWHQERGPTVWAPFKEDTDYFGRPDQQTMVNFRVSDLDAMLEQLRGAGAVVDERVEDHTSTAASAGRATRRATASSCGSPTRSANPRFRPTRIPSSGSWRSAGQHAPLVVDTRAARPGSPTPTPGPRRSTRSVARADGLPYLDPTALVMVVIEEPESAAVARRR